MDPLPCTMAHRASLVYPLPVQLTTSSSGGPPTRPHGTSSGSARRRDSGAPRERKRPAEGEARAASSSQVRANRARGASGAARSGQPRTIQARAWRHCTRSRGLACGMCRLRGPPWVCIGQSGQRCQRNLHELGATARWEARPSPCSRSSWNCSAIHLQLPLPLRWIRRNIRTTIPR